MNELAYRQGVDVLIEDGGGNYLLVQKANYKQNEWGFPGGGIENGDTPKETVKRKLKEELGSTEFEIIYESPIKIKFDWPQKDREVGFKKYKKWYQGQEKIWFIVKYTGDKQDFVLQEEEISKIKWVPYNELAEHLIFEGQWENVKSVIGEYNNSRNI